VRTFAFLLLCSCSASDWATPQHVAFAAMAIASHTACVQNNTCYFVDYCHRASEARCVDAGYEPSCADGEPEGSCGIVASDSRFR